MSSENSQNMLITEYRIPLPLTVEEYQIGQRYTTVEMSKKETGGGEGVEILQNETITDESNNGQYTYKIYHLSSKVPLSIRNLIPNGELKIHEESWNKFPYCKTELNKLNCMDDGFSVNIQTRHTSDRGDKDNVHNLSHNQLKNRNVIYIDIINDPMLDESEYNPTKFKSVKTGRGPFVGNCLETVQPIMTCYKLVATDFKWFGIETKIEKLIQSTLKILFFRFHRMLLCSMDKWYGLTIEEIKTIEKEGAIELHRQRLQGTVQGVGLKE